MTCPSQTCRAFATSLLLTRPTNEDEHYTSSPATAIGRRKRVSVGVGCRGRALRKTSSVDGVQTLESTPIVRVDIASPTASPARDVRLVSSLGNSVWPTTAPNSRLRRPGRNTNGVTQTCLGQMSHFSLGSQSKVMPNSSSTPTPAMGMYGSADWPVSPT